MNKLKLLFIGDISGRPGRETVGKVLPQIRDKHKPDLVIANCENAAGGLGVTREIITELSAYGVDFFTGGDHTFRMKQFYDDLYDPTLPFVIAANYEAENLPGKRYEILDLGPLGKVGIISLLGQEMMPGVQRVTNPFWFTDKFFDGALPYGPATKSLADIWFVDFHAETGTEKLSLAWYLRDKVQALVGTHTHIPSADNRILGGKIAYVTDAGQVGPYAASLWVNFETTIHNFKYPHRLPFDMEEGYPRIFNSVLIKFENFSPVSIERVDVIVEEGS